MGNNDLQCLLIGERLDSYKNLAKILTMHESNISAKYINADKASIKRALKKQRTATLVFISDEVLFSLESLSDLVWQYCSDAIIVILTEKTATTALKKPFNNTQISKLHLESGALNNTQNDSRLYLEYLIQTIQLKKEFRRCKRFLSVAEQRCQWLVDSSHEAVAFISRDLHLYANTTYLGLFGIDSIHELPSIPVRELMIENERSLFDGFVKKQLRKHEIKHSLVISLKKRNGKTFRANVHIIPSVYRGSPCLQLWVHPLNRYELNKDNKEEKMQKPSLQDQLLIEDTNAIEVLNRNVVTETSILHSIIKRKEATIVAQKLVGMKTAKRKNTDEHHILSLKVPAPQRVGIENLLFSEGGIRLKEKRQIFWDKVKITRLLQTLIKKKNLRTNLLVCLNEATTTDKMFLKWFKPGLSKIGVNASKLTFLLSAKIDKNDMQTLLHFARELRAFNSKIGLDDFSATSEALMLLKQLKPSYVRLSLPWVKKIEGNESREVALASFIRQLESRNIQVIAPCGVSKDMRRLFTLSGVSFCQERTLKTG